MKKRIIIILTCVVVLGTAALFFCTRGYREIPGVWESDVFTFRDSNRQGQNILVITESGYGCSMTILLSEESIYKSKIGYFDISAFSANFQEKGIDGIETSYHYNPLTNHIKSGERIYKKSNEYGELYDLICNEKGK